MIQGRPAAAGRFWLGERVGESKQVMVQQRGYTERRMQ